MKHFVLIRVFSIFIPAIPPIGKDILVSERNLIVSHRDCRPHPDSYPVTKHSFLFSKSCVELPAGERRLSSHSSRTSVRDTKGQALQECGLKTSDSFSCLCGLLRPHCKRSTPSILYSLQVFWTSVPLISGFVVL